MKKRLLLSIIVVIMISIIVIITKPKVYYVERTYHGESDIWSIDFHVTGSYFHPDKEEVLVDQLEFTTKMDLEYKENIEFLTSIYVEYFGNGRGVTKGEGHFEMHELVFLDNDPKYWISKYERIDSIEVEITWNDGEEKKEKIIIKLTE